MFEMNGGDVKRGLPGRRLSLQLLHAGRHPLTSVQYLVQMHSVRDTAAPLLRFDQSGALLRKVMENAAVGMALVGVDRRLLYANSAFAEMVGEVGEAVLGREFETFIHTEDDTAIVHHLARLVVGEAEDHRGECQLRHRDGAAVWVMASASLLRSENTGRPLYVIWQVLNIDRQKRAEAALAYSESRWNYALESAGQGVWDHDIRRDDMFYSRMWRAMRGIGEHEYVDPAQSEWLKRVHPDDVPRILATVDKQDRGEEGFDTLEYRERHRDGHWIWILSRGKPVEWAPDGTPVRTVGTDTDITRLKNVEALLAEEKERLAVTLRSIGDGVISTDADGIVTFMNPVAEQLTGWTSEAAVGALVTEVFAVKDESGHAVASSPVATCLARDEVAYVEDDVVLVGRDASRRYIRASAAPLHAAGGGTIGAVLVFQDITSSRTLQKQLAHSATHDMLTGLPNRVAFERAMREVTASPAGARHHVLAFIDLDYFKAVNDGSGHAAGDALLQQVAEVIRGGCRRNDLAARIGGDEFALLLTDCPLAAAKRVVGNIAADIAALRFEWDGKSYRIGASVGLTTFGVGNREPATLMRDADSACYAAKARGRGQVMVFEAD
jgi:diguanylate cyclase